MPNNFLRVAAGQRINHTPIWFMRQAGRFLPEFLSVKSKFNSFFEMCLDVNAVAEVTMQPIKRFDIDAAIIFSDILIVPYFMGYDVSFIKDYGPVISKDIIYPDRKKLVFDAVAASMKKCKLLLQQEKKKCAMIGFAGAPWTVACYMLEAGPTKTFYTIKSMMYDKEEKLQLIIEELIEQTILHIKNQIDNGADVIKIFDSLAGILEEEYFIKYIIVPTKKIVDAIRKYNHNTKIICFPKGAGIMYKTYVDTIKPDVIALDSTVPLSWAIKNLKNVVFQGNLDNILAACSAKISILKTQEIIDAFGNGAFIFNLGHGILPNTPIQNIEAIISTIRNYGKR